MRFLSQVVLVFGLLQYAGSATGHAVEIYSATFLVAIGYLGLSTGWLYLRRITRMAPGKEFPAPKLSFLEQRVELLPAAETHIQNGLVGHDEVVTHLVRSELIPRLSHPASGRLVGSFLLVGPTGTGKTSLARLLSEGLFHSPPVLINMAQFQTRGQSAALFSRGNSVAGTSGVLVEAVRRSPYQVIVLDELDKAESSTWDALLAFLDNASCIDEERGKWVDFSGCIVIATANTGEATLAALHGTQFEEAWQIAALSILAREVGFPAPFLARWSRVYLMKGLGELDQFRAAALAMARYCTERHGLTLNVARPEALVSTLTAMEGFPGLGLRPLLAFLRTKLDVQLSAAKRDGWTGVVLTTDGNGRLVLKRAPSSKETS